MKYLQDQCFEILEGTRNHYSDVLPSEWYEKNMIMPKGSAMPGAFSFNHTPFWREVLDCFSPNHPAKEVTAMKGAQLGGTAAVLNAIICYVIANDPSNTMLLTGHSDLSKDAMRRIDDAIDACGLRSLIGNSTLRERNSRTGDTDKSKEFLAGGWLKSGSVTNHNLLRQYDVKNMIVDDFDAAPNGSKEAGATRELVQKRTSAFRYKKKIYWMSSPQVEGRSNIEEVFLLGDQRYYNVPCPCCGELIVLNWSIDIDGTDGKEKGGIHWENDSNGRVDRASVGYICQKCSGFFDDRPKYEMNLAGEWIPTVVAKEEDHYSYHISSLYAPSFMDNWADYAQQYVNANPLEGKRNEKKHQTFKNVVLGETYKQSGKTPKANVLQKNIRNYDIREVPDQMSQRDGNGHIVMLTCACDLNGHANDSRLDFEVVGWSENASSYSILHGSIGTFIPNEGKKKNKVDRERWTYEFGRENSVWPEFDKILDTVFLTDGGRSMKIFISGVDTGYHTSYAYDYIDQSNFNIVGLKGDVNDKPTRYGVDLPIFKKAKERSNLYLLEVNLIKDRVADSIALKWDKGNDPNQPHGFMNYPTPSNGLYLFNNFFSHFEGEHRVLEEKDGKPSNWVWKKVNSKAQNHFWDCYVYNFALKDLITSIVCKEVGMKDYTWTDFVNLILGRNT